GISAVGAWSRRRKVGLPKAAAFSPGSRLHATGRCSGATPRFAVWLPTYCWRWDRPAGVMFFATEVLVRAECMAYSRTLPDWVPAHWWSLTNMLDACQFNDRADFILDLVAAVIVGLGALAFAVNWLLRGVRAVLSFVGGGSGRSTETELSLSSTLRGRVT